MRSIAVALYWLAIAFSWFMNLKSLFFFVLYILYAFIEFRAEWLMIKMPKDLNFKRTSASLFLEFLLFFAALLAYGSQGLNIEGQYLLEIKAQLKDNMNYLDDWNSKDQTPCRWTGVTCNRDYDPVVFSLDLNAMNLSGTLSPSIGKLVHLTNLDVAFNELSGEIPRSLIVLN